MKTFESNSSLTPSSGGSEVKEAKAILTSTERGVRIKVIGVAPKMDYSTRKPRSVSRQLSPGSKARKVRTYASLDLTPLRHEHLAYVTLHYPEVDCFELYAATPAMVAEHWRKMREWLDRNVPNPITGKSSFVWNMEYKWSMGPHRSLPLVIDPALEKRMIAAWRKIVGHPASLPDDAVVHFSRRDPEMQSPEAILTYMAKSKGHQEFAPLPWTAQDLNPPGWWGVVGMESLPVKTTTIKGEKNIAEAKAYMRAVSSTEIKTYTDKSGEVRENFRTLWSANSPKGNSEVRNDGDGLFLHEEITRLYGAEDDVA